MSRCFFLFKNEDYENYKNLIEKDDILLSVSPVDNIDTQKYKYICLNSFDEFSVDIEEFTIFYKKYFQFDKDSWAFANNFYETCYQYYSKLSFIINFYNVEYIFFPKKITQYSYFGFLKYIAAEYETQKVFLYKRESAFLYLTRSIIEGTNVKIKYLNNGIGSFYFSFNFLRLFILFGIEFIRVVLSSRQIFYKSSENKSMHLYIFRTSKTFNFAAYRLNSIFNDLFYNNSISSNGFNKKFENYKKMSLNILDITKVYLKVLKNIITILFKKSDHKINFTQAFLEIQIMSIQPRIYYLTLNRHFDNLNYVNTVFNFEVKSPYAYFDKKVSDENNKKLVTILTFDLLEKKMPEMFYSSILHVSNNNIKNQLNNVVSANKTIINVFNLHRFKIKTNKNFTRYNYCLFLGTDLKQNLERINVLYDLNVSFCIRKHPRDKYEYEEKFKDLFISREIIDSEFFNFFKYGITGASGLVDVLIANSKPFYLLEGDFYIDLKSMPYYKKGYYGNLVYTKKLMSSIDDSLLEKSFKNYYPTPLEFNLTDFYKTIDGII